MSPRSILQGEHPLAVAHPAYALEKLKLYLCFTLSPRTSFDSAIMNVGKNDVFMTSSLPDSFSCLKIVFKSMSYRK
jgi:hypothetical protein